MKESEPARRSPLLAGALSALLPGLGHVSLRQWYRGVAILLSFLVLTGIVAWYAEPLISWDSSIYPLLAFLAWFKFGGFWYLAPAGMWLWNIWDAASLAGCGRTRTILIPLLFGMMAAYGIGWQLVEVDFSAASLDRAMAIIRPMLYPDMVEERRELNRMWTYVSVPCSATETPPQARREEDGKVASATPDCAKLSEALTVSVSGMWPDTDTIVWWETAIGDDKPLGGNENAPLIVRTDATGSLTVVIHVPSTVMIAQPDPSLMLQHRVYFDQYRPLGGYQITSNGGFVLKGMMESVTMALMATTLSILLAIPISFLAARNLMGGNPFTLFIYVITRTILNFVRSIEALILAIVFVIIVGLGPFAGVMALAVHSVVALAKLYSEVIEGIDPGPIEAVKATGANWLQVARYGVIPQIVPPFTAFTIYRWDINVRMSIIIGMVGGGGIGQYLIQWIQINEMGAVGAAFIAIAVVVITLDYLSAKVRERLV
ncbi:MAG: ABC-type phosphonates transport system permease protein [Anaerolineaceae bacterium]|nr:MAG: ABC-type phosphonates transport system permease protein [Anaerolineaceae bacterium]